jgi:hypothetical protein
LIWKLDSNSSLKAVRGERGNKKGKETSEGNDIQGIIIG